MTSPVLVMVGVAGSGSRVDLLGVPPDLRTELLAVMASIGISVEVEVDIIRCDSDLWAVNRLLAAITQTAPARIWRWAGDDGTGGWERDRRTPGQAASGLIEIVSVTTLDGTVELDVLGESRRDHLPLDPACRMALAASHDRGGRRCDHRVLRRRLGPRDDGD